MAEEGLVQSSAIRAVASVLAAGLLGGGVYLVQLQPRVAAMERDIETNQAVISAAMRERTLRDMEHQRFIEEMRLRLQALELAR